MVQFFRFTVYYYYYYYYYYYIFHRHQFSEMCM